MNNDTSILLLISSQIFLLFVCAFFWLRAKVEKKQFNERLCFIEKSLNYAIKKTFKPKFYVGQSVLFSMYNKYTHESNEIIGIIIEVSEVNYIDKEFYYTIYCKEYKKPIKVIKEDQLKLIQTPPSLSDSAHKTPDPSPVE